VVVLGQRAQGVDCDARERFEGGAMVLLDWPCIRDHTQLLAHGARSLVLLEVPLDARPADLELLAKAEHGLDSSMSSNVVVDFLENIQG